MTYKLEPGLRKIQSPVVLVIEGMETRYPDGKAVTELTFDKSYLIQSVTARESSVVIQLMENEQINKTEETTISFF